MAGLRLSAGWRQRPWPCWDSGRACLGFGEGGTARPPLSLASGTLPALRFYFSTSYDPPLFPLI